MTDILAPARPMLPSAPPSRTAVRVAFSGDGGTFLRLICRGALLELITVGFYRFWLATDMRRHLWLHTSVAGDSAEYTGSGKELLIGFLFAMAILVPIYVLYFLAGVSAESAQAFASFPFFVFLYLFGQFAIYRARRYRLTRTVWRGVRFWMTGSGWSYAWRATLWGLWVLVTAGLALPWRTAALERFKMRHTYYGDLQASFEGTGGAFFKRGWWLWLLTALTFWLYVPLLLIYPLYKAMEWKWFIAGVRFDQAQVGQVRFESGMTVGALMGVYWKTIGWGLLLLAGIAGLAALSLALVGQILAGSITAGFSEVFFRDHIVAGAVLLAVHYLLFVLALNVVIRFYLVRDLWRRVARTVTIYNLEAAANVTAKGELTNALGEGLTGSMDIVGF